MALKLFNETRRSLWISRVLFLVAFFGCQSGGEEGKSDLTVLWEDDRAIGFTIPTSSNFDHELLTIRVKNSGNQFVLGEWSRDNEKSTFRTLVPFTPNITYELYKGQELIETFEIESPSADPPEIIAIYPSSDTVPENLLKMYLQFSGPMSEGKAIQNITVVDLNNGDTLEGTFLDLQPELWNEDNTLLTLWLDPGRIKRGLIPNLEMGNPLSAGSAYKMIIKKDWRGASGIPLSKSYHKQFYASVRDDKSPGFEEWILGVPRADTNNPLKIEFGEHLDGILATETIDIIDSEGNLIPGMEHLLENETVYNFRPDQNWTTGSYMILIETRLEDLAGNNINRLFEREISEKTAVENTRDVIELSFEIQ